MVRNQSLCNCSYLCLFVSNNLAPPGCVPGCGKDVPLCWAFGEQVICQESISTRNKILANNLHELAGSTDENAVFKAANEENLPFCQVFDDSRVRCSNSVKPPPEKREFHLATHAGSESDEDMFKAADTNNTGYFTYDQFLVHTNSKNDLPTILYFNKYAWAWASSLKFLLLMTL